MSSPRRRCERTVNNCFDSVRPPELNAHPPAPRRVHAFTLVEMLAVCLVLAIVGSLLIASLGSMRRRQSETRCLANLRWLGVLLQQYASEYRDAPPVYIDDAPTRLDTRDRRARFVVQGYFAFSSGVWRRFSGLTIESPTMFCPSVQPDYLASQRRYADWRSDYAMTMTLLIDPPALDPDSTSPQPPPRYGLRHQKLSAVQFPSSKVGIYESLVWHAWKGSYFPGVDLTPVTYHGVPPVRGSIWLFDGSARAHPARESPMLRRDEWGGAPYDTTPWGVRGRDLVSTQ